MKNFSILAILMAFIALLPLQAHAELKVRVTGAGAEPLPIAIPNFVGHNPADNALGARMVAVITNNLGHSGLFKPLDPHSFIQDAASASANPNFGEWKSINAQALVTGQVNKTADGRTR